MAASFFCQCGTVQWVQERKDPPPGKTHSSCSPPPAESHAEERLLPNCTDSKPPLLFRQKPCCATVSLRTSRFETPRPTITFIVGTVVCASHELDRMARCDLWVSASADLLACLYSSPHPVKEFVHPATWADMAAIVSFLAPIVVGFGLLRILRTLRVLHTYQVVARAAFHRLLSQLGGNHCGGEPCGVYFYYDRLRLPDISIGAIRAIVNDS